MADETQIPAAPQVKPVASPLSSVKPVASPLSSTTPTPSPVSSRPAMSLELPKAKYTVAARPAATAPMKKVEVKKEEKPSIISMSFEFVAAAVAIAFAVMIVLDI